MQFNKNGLAFGGLTTMAQSLLKTRSLHFTKERLSPSTGNYTVNKVTVFESLVYFPVVNDRR